MLNNFKPSGQALPCPICNRTKDGDCRILSDGRVFCHTEQQGIKGKKSESNELYIYLGKSDEAQGAGMWKLGELPLAKAPREYGIRYFDYFFWDGSAVPAQRYRKDVEGQPKEVKWASSLQGRPQTDIAPYRWEKVQEAQQIFVVRGELKAQLLAGKGFAAISCLNQKDEQLATELKAKRANGVEIVLVPDCDRADLDKWFGYLSSEVPGVKQLLAPGLPWSNPPADGGLGIEDWIYAKAPSNDEITAAISSIGADGLSSNEKNYDTLEGKIKQVVDKHKDPLKQSALIKKEAFELGFPLTAAEVNAFISDIEYQEPIPDTHLNPQPCQDEPKLWGNLFLYQSSNLIVAPPKVGKSALAIHLFACMYRGESHCLGQPIHNRCKTLIIVGSDMNRSQWHKLLIREGLATVVDGKVRLVPGVILFPKGKKIQLDSQGRKTIKKLALDNPNSMILIDTYRSVTASLGLAEGTREAAIPVELLFESLAEIKSGPTILIAHHSKLAGGSNAANSSAGGYAIPSAFDQTINMSWLHPNSIGMQSDKRILLHSSGRGSQDQSICIELTGTDPNPVRWISHGNAEELIKAQDIIKTEASLDGKTIEKVYDHVQGFYQANGRGVDSRAIREEFQIKQFKADRLLNKLCDLDLVFRMQGLTASAGSKGGRPAALYYPHYAERTEEGSASFSTSGDLGGRSDRREATEPPSNLPDLDQSSSSQKEVSSTLPQKEEPCPPLKTEFSTGFNDSSDPLVSGVTSVKSVSNTLKIPPDPLVSGVTSVKSTFSSSSSFSSSLKEPIPTSLMAGLTFNASALYANDSANDTEKLKPQLEQAVQVFRQGQWESGWTICDSRNPHSLRVRRPRDTRVEQLANKRWGIDVRPEPLEVPTSPSNVHAHLAGLDTSSEGSGAPSSGLEMPVIATTAQEDSFF